MNTDNKTQGITLESISERKAALKAEIKTQNEVIAEICRDLFVPVEPSTKAEALIEFRGSRSCLKFLLVNESRFGPEDSFGFEACCG